MECARRRKNPKISPLLSILWPEVKDPAASLQMESELFLCVGSFLKLYVFLHWVEGFGADEETDSLCRATYDIFLHAGHIQPNCTLLIYNIYQTEVQPVGVRICGRARGGGTQRRSGAATVRSSAATVRSGAATVRSAAAPGQRVLHLSHETLLALYQESLDVTRQQRWPLWALELRPEAGPMIPYRYQEISWECARRPWWGTPAYVCRPRWARS
jgi:hypothetical protein